MKEVKEVDMPLSAEYKRNFAVFRTIYRRLDINAIFPISWCMNTKMVNNRQYQEYTPNDKIYLNLNSIQVRKSLENADTTKTHSFGYQ